MNISNLRLIVEYRNETKEYAFSAPAITVDGITFALEQKEDTYRISAKSEQPLGIRSMALQFTYRGDFDFSESRTARISDWYYFGYNKIDDNPPESLQFWIANSHRDPCFYMGTMIPQNTKQDYQAKVLAKDTLRVTAKVYYQRGQAKQKELFSEWVWLSDTMPILETIQTWAAKQPYITRKETMNYGWNSWDYYFETVSHDDIVENVQVIKADPVLSKKVKYITVDDGWSHAWGVWEPNYRFPGGMKATADYIKEQGFVPGIWTEPFIIRPATYYARRHPEILVKDENGDPCQMGNRFYLDPTCPEGEKYIFDLYKGLYDAGYRFFKTDFINDITNAPGFYREDLGYYEVIRHFYKIFRSAVGPDAEVLGCNLYAETGGGLVESNRAALDIHNNWRVLRKAVLSLQTRFWWPDHIAPIDGDFMVVRGPETSNEDPCSILYVLCREGGKDIRLFNAVEAQTWANIAAFLGGNRFLSDRISALNEKGMEILRKGFEFEFHPHFLPLDLGRKELAEYWYKKTDTSEYLMLINFEDTPQMMGEDIELPFAIKPRMLEPHASVIIKKGEE